MKTFILIVLLSICFSKLIYSQFFDDKISVCFGYAYSSILGNNYYTKDDFKIPAFYSNMKKYNSGYIKFLYKSNELHSLGFGVKKSIIEDWKLENYDIYNEAKIKYFSLLPILQIHNKYSETGIQNRMKFYIELSPEIGKSHTTIAHSLNEIHSFDDTISSPTKTSNFFFSISESVGSEFYINYILGVFINYGMQQAWITSQLYNENFFFSTQIKFGILIRLARDKQYFN